MTGPVHALRFMRMHIGDLAEVQVIEDVSYPNPWTRGNFVDSLHSGHETWVVRDASNRLIGYFLIMLAMDEAHLLNITVHASMQGQGIGHILLDKVVAIAQEKGMSSVLLEVRPSNHRALSVYKHYGFSEIGIRKNYYPVAQNAREDAIVMRLPI
jgi:ribosomal-protein-alanine N-acetyltransferase